jgi:predicted metal-binding protein
VSLGSKGCNKAGLAILCIQALSKVIHTIIVPLKKKAQISIIVVGPSGIQCHEFRSNLVGGICHRCTVCNWRYTVASSNEVRVETTNVTVSTRLDPCT